MLRQSIPWDLTRRAHQVSPHELVMGGISHVGSQNPDITVSTWVEHRGSSHNSKRAQFSPPHLEIRVHLPALLVKESRASRRTSRGAGLNLKMERNSKGRATITKEPHVSIHSRETWFPCNDSTDMPSINSKHDGRCDSPVAPWEKAIDPYVNSTGSLTLLFQLERKADLHVSTPDEAWLPCGTP